MAEPHYLGGGVNLPGSVGAVDDHFFLRYRSLLDAEDAAFDELEHAYEDGDREHWESDLQAWQHAISRRLAYLARYDVDLTAKDPRLTLRV
jgi:hypothetical protein